MDMVSSSSSSLPSSQSSLPSPTFAIFIDDPLSTLFEWPVAGVVAVFVVVAVVVAVAFDV